jgi:hypothetical protein
MMRFQCRSQVRMSIETGHALYHGFHFVLQNDCPLVVKASSLLVGNVSVSFEGNLKFKQIKLKLKVTETKQGGKKSLQIEWHFFFLSCVA